MKRRYAILGMASLLAVALAVPALGGPSNPVAEGAASAKKIAKKAKKKAKQANKAAKAAQASANSAQSSANSAQSTANGAQTAAEGAQASADAAQATADGAQSAANSAQSTADAAYSDVDFNSGTTSPTDSSPTRLASAACDSGYEVTGGGYTIGGAGNDAITTAINQQYGSGWLVLAQEIPGGTASTWNLTVSVNCID